MRQSTSITGCVRWLVGRSVCLSVGDAFVRRSTRRTYWPTWPCLSTIAPKMSYILKFVLNWTEFLKKILKIDFKCSYIKIHHSIKEKFKRSIFLVTCLKIYSLLCWSVGPSITFLNCEWFLAFPLLSNRPRLSCRVYLFIWLYRFIWMSVCPLGLPICFSSCLSARLSS